MSATRIENDAAHAEFIANSKAQPNALHIVEFFASWHEPSVSMIEVLNTIQSSNQSTDPSIPTVKAAVVDAEQCESIAVTYEQLQSVPSFFFFRAGKLIDCLEGADATALTERVNKHLQTIKQSIKTTNQSTPQSSAPATANGLTPEISTRLASLLNAAPVMAFIKGTPAAPRCGFTRKLIELLNANNIEFSSFDILSDQTIRESLKVYSNWPTYPQVYLDGELMGGLDVVKELIEAGEFVPSTQPKSEKPAVKASTSQSNEKWFDASLSMTDRVNALVNSSPVLLCMKGDKSSPQCGFSRQAVEMLNSITINDQPLDYSTFDVFSNNDLREGIKTVNNWPTFPQLYVNGSLIGGLDVMKELHEGGELQSELEQAKQQ